MNDGDRWRRVEHICQAALDLPGERDRFLRDACGDDADLRDDVAALLAKAPAGDEFLTAPLAALAAHVMPQPSDVADRAAPGGLGNRHVAGTRRHG